MTAGPKLSWILDAFRESYLCYHGKLLAFEEELSPGPSLSMRNCSQTSEIKTWLCISLAGLVQWCRFRKFGPKTVITASYLHPKKAKKAAFIACEWDCVLHFSQRKHAMPFFSPKAVTKSIQEAFPLKSSHLCWHFYSRWKQWRHGANVERGKRARNSNSEKILRHMFMNRFDWYFQHNLI